MNTKPTKIADIKRSWHLLDAKDQILGRFATGAVVKLMGKTKPYFVRNLDCGDYVVVVNAKDIKVTGKKEKQKIYDRYSGFPGGRKAKALWQVRSERPTEMVYQAIDGMLPKNKLRDKLITRLYVYAGEEHPYKNKFTK